MLWPERQEQRVLGCRGLKLEIELTAEPLAQRQAPRLVDSAAERRVQYELHPAGLVEKALEHQRLLRRHGAERQSRPGEIGNRLLGGFSGRAGFSAKPFDSPADVRVTHGPAKAGHYGFLSYCPAKAGHYVLGHRIICS